MSRAGRKFSFLEAATTAEHVALLGHSVRRWVPVSGSPQWLAETILMLANLMQISI